MKRLIWLAVALFLAGVAFAQDPVTGFPPFGSFQDGQFDGINRQNLNVNFAIPVASNPARGGNFSFSIVYDSLAWKQVTTGSTTTWSPVTDSDGTPNWGWKKDLVLGSIFYAVRTRTCKDYDGVPPIIITIRYYTAYSFIDRFGTRHNFAVTVGTGGFCGLRDVETGFATDNSGYYLDATDPTSPIFFDKSGVKVTNFGTKPDTNGNFISKTVVNTIETDWIDTSNHVALKIFKYSDHTDYQYPDTSGTYQTVRLTFGTFQLKTNFACSGVVEYTGTASLPTSISFPNGQSYSFTYEPTPGFSGYLTGRVQQVTLPTGGTYKYEYLGANDSINCSDSSVTNLKRTISDGTTPSVWQFTRTPGGTNWTTTVTAPQMPYDTVGNDTAFTFDTTGRETSEKFYQGSAATGQLLRTLNNNWAANGTPSTRTTILEDNLTQSSVDIVFDSNGNMQSTVERDWGSGAPGPALRTSSISYLVSTAYTSRNILNRVTQTTVSDAAGTVQFRQAATYDDPGSLNPCPTGAAQHDDTNYGCSFTTRGNLTSVTTYKAPATSTGPVTKTFVYDSLGNLRSATTSCCQQRQWNFSSGTQYAYPDSIVSGPSSGTQLTTQSIYNPYTGLAATTTDENNQVTSYTYADPLKRLTLIQRPDSAQTTYSYDDLNHTTTVATPVDGTNVAKRLTTYDGLGRPIKVTTLDASGTSYSIVETKYDPLGRAYMVSNAHNSTAQYWTTTRFDALGRTTKMILQDGCQILYTYAGATVTVSDPTGKQRKSQFDGIGRLVAVFEPDPANGNTLTLQTSYTYTVLDKLATVTQGAQTRTYSYDGLGRLTSKKTPEAAQAQSTYQYNDFDLVTQRTDPRGVVTNYSYDSLNRAVGVSYTIPQGSIVAAMPNVCDPAGGPTPTANLCYFYDQGGSAAYALGRLTKMADPAGSETYTYDRLGRVTQLQKAVGSVTYPIGYQYNQAGSMTSLTYPSTRVVQQSYDGIGRLSTISSGGTNFASGFGYDPAGHVTGLLYGNGVCANWGYSADRQQLQSLKYFVPSLANQCQSTPSSTLFSLNYGYMQGGGNNGQVTSITDNMDAGRSVTYTYDALSRLTNAVTTASVPYPKWGLNWTYDRYGNPLAQTQTYDAPASYSVSVDGTTNRILGDTYDLNGNMTFEPVPNNNYKYDGENRLVSFQNGGATYSYDGNGLRVQKTSGGITTTYIFSSGQLTAEYTAGAAPASPTREYIYGTMGELTATMQGGTATYHLRDQLSVRVNADANGNKTGEQGHYPYGETWYASGTTTKWKFTNYERDAESGNDYAIARFYVSRLGRFYSPNPSDGNLAAPQTLGLYAYAADDPIDNTDPDGRLMTSGFSDGCSTGPLGTPPFFPSGGFPWPIWWPGGTGGEESRPRFPLFPILALIRALEDGGSGIKPPLATCNCKRQSPKPALNRRCIYNCVCGAGFKLFGMYTSVESYLLEGMRRVKGCEDASKKGTECPPNIESVEINILGKTSYALVACVTVQ